MTDQLPASGGSYVRDAEGKLSKADAPKPAPAKPTKKKG